MMNTKKLAKRATLAALLIGGLGMATPVLAQLPPPPTPTSPPTPTVPPTQVPLDGGILLLAAAGAAYGAKKVYNNRKRTNG